MKAFLEELRPRLGPKDSIDIITTMPNRYHSALAEARPLEKEGAVTIRRISLPGHQSGMFDQAYAYSHYFFGVMRYTWGHSYDLVFATTGRLFTGFLGAFISRLKGAGFYLDIRDIFTETIQNVSNSPVVKILMPVFHLMERFTVRSAWKVNLVSQGFQSHFQLIDPKKTFSIFTNGIDGEFIGIDYNLPSPYEKIAVLYAGNIGEGQGLEKIVPAAAKALEETHHFLVIGDGGAKGKLLEQLEAQEVRNVELLPPVNREKLLEYYRTSDVMFLHLNNYRAFERVLPSKLFELATTNKPIVAGVGGYAKRFIEENISDAYVFEPCQPEQCVRILRDYTPNPIDRSSFVDAFRRTAIMKQMAQDFLSYCH